MTWLKYLVPVFRVLAAIMKLFVASKQRRYGRLEAENAQAAKDLKMLRKASDARRSVSDSVDGVRDDPRNRDAR